jgi:hypothetical protein
MVLILQPAITVLVLQGYIISIANSPWRRTAASVLLRNDRLIPQTFLPVRRQCIDAGTAIQHSRPIFSVLCTAQYRHWENAYRRRWKTDLKVFRYPYFGATGIALPPGTIMAHRHPHQTAGTPPSAPKNTANSSEHLLIYPLIAADRIILPYRHATPL